jgi:hypothetical protein
MSVVDLAARTARATNAAVDAGRALGLTVDEPRVLHDVFSVVVHLAPSPVVARVPTVLTSTPAGLAARQRDELAVAGWLADQGLPVVPPSPLVPREPVPHDGFSMTFWQFVEQDPTAEPDFFRNTASTARLHAALRDFPGELPFLGFLDDSVTESLTALAARPDLLAPADLDRARREWAVLEPVVRSREGFAAAFPGVGVQTVHGDAPFYNVIPTADGELWSDFECVALGPVECDLALLGEEGLAIYDAAAAELGLRPLDERVLNVMGAARQIQVVAALALVDALPSLAENLAPVVESWRGSPFAGGLADR